ncbi:MAG: OmpA family protein [Deltaproteobacteria bacterium]|nr:OmpA family protein [Deltaproteobacteria bacterium]
MKTKTFLAFAIVSLLFSACVSNKKYKNLDTSYKKMQESEKSCSEQLKNFQASITDLSRQKTDLESQVDYLKKNSNQVLNALQDMSVLSSKQAESVKQSLADISKKDAYINNLQSAIARKDSLNMILVMNLKSSLADINDQDINIKVDKGVIYVDISDKLLFNSGKYIVTSEAKKVLGKVAQVLDAHPDIEFLVEGHTDNVPIRNACMEDNWDLSVKRATSVVRILENEYKH